MAEKQKNNKKKGTGISYLFPDEFGQEVKYMSFIGKFNSKDLFPKTKRNSEVKLVLVKTNKEKYPVQVMVLPAFVRIKQGNFFVKKDDCGNIAIFESDNGIQVDKKDWGYRDKVKEVLGIK